MEENKLLVKELKTNYKTFGQGRPVLVLHGWGGKSDSWVGVGELLARDGHQVIVPDLPGFGKSEEPKNPWTVDDYLKFVDDFVVEMKLDKFDLIGHSLGGGLAAAYAVKKSQKVDRLVLCDSAITRKERLDWRQSYAKKMAQGGKFLLALPFAGGILPFARKLVYKVAGVHDYQQASPVMKKTFQNIIKEDLIGYAKLIKSPTLIIWGDKDKSTPVDDAYELNKIISASKLEIIKDCGHNPHRTHAPRLAEIIINFLQ